MFSEGIFPIGEGLLDVNESRLNELLVPHDINDIYDVEQTPFARGKFATVRRAVHKNTGVHFAAKFLKRRRRAQSSDKEIKHEIAVLMLCADADNIVKLNTVHESRSETALLLDLATGGELQTFLDSEEYLSEYKARICMREVLKALQFLHKRSIVHLDLKPQNILLTGENIEDGLKLCDFGISRVVAEGTNVREIVGTPDYVAPEVLQYEPLSLQTDIWSVGVLAYVLLSGFSPFGGETKQETFLNISQCALTFPDKLFGSISVAATDFIRRALRIKPSDRMTTAGCLEHIWLKDECPIDRHIFGDNTEQHQETTNGHSQKAKDDEEESENNEGDKHTANGIHGEHCQKSKNQCNFLAEIEQKNNSFRMQIYSEEHIKSEITDSSNTGLEPNYKCQTIAKINADDHHSARNYDKIPILPSKQPTVTTKYSTMVINVPATRATTIPIYNSAIFKMQSEIARRHSSGANKENTYLATANKNILHPNIASAPGVVLKNVTLSSCSPSPTTNSATIIITAPKTVVTKTTENYATTVSTMVNGKNSIEEALSPTTQQCIFPDAPTTPKVIRKGSNEETSPTSVKALVKKFQLEDTETEKRLKDTNYQYEVHIQQPMQKKKTYELQKESKDKNCISPSRSINGSENLNLNIAKNHKHMHGEVNCRKYSHSLAVPVENNSHHVGNLHVNSTRRASEPLTTIHKKFSPHFCSPPSPPTASQNGLLVTSYKSTCVFDDSGCRHSATTNSCDSDVSSNRSTANITTKNNSLLKHHHRHHNHHTHLHRHVVAKNSSSNNLSLDQGIIC